MNKVPKHHMLAYVFSYMAIGALLPLIGKYLGSIGFTGAQLGTITSAGTFVAIFAAGFWGGIYDKLKNGKRLIAFLCVTSAIVALSLTEIKIYGLFLAVYGVMYFFQAPIMGLVDAMCIEEGNAFGASRMWGAIGYAVGAFLSGELVGYTDIKIIFFIYAICFIVSAASIMTMARKSQNEKTEIKTHNNEKEKGGLKLLLKNKKYIKILIAIFFIGGTNVANNTYFVFLYKDCGGSMVAMGITMLLMVGSEAPFMAISERLARKFTLEKTIAIAMIISVLRYGWYSLYPSSDLITALFFLQGMVNGIVLVEIIRYISKTVKEEMIGIAVSWYYAVSSNGSTIICQLIGGFALDKWGSGGVYLFFTIYNLIGVILYIGLGLHRSDGESTG